MSILPSRAHRSPRPEKGERVYVIGDVHGRNDLLQILLNKIVAHFPTLLPEPEKVTVLFLGDVIDRGPNSKKCLSRIGRLVETANAKMLLGNHEDMLLASLEGNGEAQRAWLRNGGLATLESYRIEPPREEEDPLDFAERLYDRIPTKHIEFLKSLDVSYTSGSYFFVHAGVRPGVAIAKQEREDLYSIRDEFTASDKWHGQVVVHGHSIVGAVEVRENRIACDTGAYASGTLSCVCLQDTMVSVITT